MDERSSSVKPHREHCQHAHRGHLLLSVAVVALLFTTPATASSEPSLLAYEQHYGGTGRRFSTGKSKVRGSHPPAPPPIHVSSTSKLIYNIYTHLHFYPMMYSPATDDHHSNTKYTCRQISCGSSEATQASKRAQTDAATTMRA